jgi:hypothetical protein
MSKITPQEAEEIKTRATALAIDAVAAAQVKALTKPITDAVAQAVREIAGRPEPEPAPVVFQGDYPLPDFSTWQRMAPEKKRAALAVILDKADTEIFEGFWYAVANVNDAHAQRNLMHA